MYNFNAYYGVIEDYNYLQLPQNGAFFFDYIINDVIMCSDVKHFPVIFYQT